MWSTDFPDSPRGLPVPAFDCVVDPSCGRAMNTLLLILRGVVPAWGWKVDRSESIGRDGMNTPSTVTTENRALERTLVSGTHVGSVSRICLVEWGPACALCRGPPRSGSLLIFDHWGSLRGAVVSTTVSSARLRRRWPRWLLHRGGGAARGEGSGGNGYYTKRQARPDERRRATRIRGSGGWRARKARKSKEGALAAAARIIKRRAATDGII